MLNDHHGVGEVCPLLTVHFLLGIPYDVAKRAFSPYRWGNQMQWPSNKGSAIFYTRNTKRGGLKLNYRQGTVNSPHAIWIWMDRSGAEPYRGPGDDYFKDANVGYGKSLSSRPKGFLGVMPLPVVI